MPVSDYHQISDVLHVVQQVNPQRVLDVGVGFGKWGILCREILDVYGGHLHPESWSRQIEGIEIYAPYHNPLWDLAYNKVHIGDATSLLGGLGKFDLIICCDVIEHFSKPDGMAFLDAMLGHTDVLIVTSPRGYTPQGAAYGNERETHLSGWAEADFKPWPYRYKEIGFTFMAVLATNPELVARLSIPQPLDVLGVKKGLFALLRLMATRARLRFRRLLQRPVGEHMRTGGGNQHP